jgi:hypothetical protein
MTIKEKSFVSLKNKEIYCLARILVNKLVRQ